MPAKHSPAAIASAVPRAAAWLKADRVVRKGQKGIKIVAPVMGGDSNAKVVTITPAWVFDVRQTDERTPRAA